MTLDHLSQTCRNSAMLIPYGDYKNSFLHDVRPGDVLADLDDAPIKVLEITRVGIHSALTNALSMLIYNMPIETVFAAMRANWGYEVNKNDLFLIIYKTDV